MSASAAKLATRVIGWQLTFSAATAGVLALLSSFLLLLSGAAAIQSAIAVSAAVLVGGTLAAAHSWWLAWRRRYLLRALSLGSKDIDHFELPKLNDDPWRIVNAWTAVTLLSLVLFTTVWRPIIIAPTTGLTLGLLGSVIVATAALPLLVLVRRAFLGALESAPPEIMREIIETNERMGRLRGRISRRLLAALATPVLFLSIGSALIANAHLREADERNREESARALARAVLERVPGASGDAGLGQALQAAERLGFNARVHQRRANYLVSRQSEGRVSLVAPLDAGSAEVRFHGSTVSVLGTEPFIVAILAIAAAAGIGIVLARMLSNDLRTANLGVRMLGTDAALEGTRVMKPAQFWAVAELGRAIELLAQRFRQFAHAQERSIEAKESATRMRGLFFASVSHDLKSPLNAILGFAELVRRSEELTPEQAESLELIVRRGRELLALIETILDAARVEAGQLTLVKEREDIEDLLAFAIEKGKDLSSNSDVIVLSEISEGLPQIYCDRTRLAQALATFIGHARRSAVRPSMRVRAGVRLPTQRPQPNLYKQKLRIDIEIPSPRFTAQELEAMLDPERQPGQHRGLALGLRLARSIVEHHGGRVRVTGRTVTEPAFLVELPLS